MRTCIFVIVASSALISMAKADGVWRASSANGYQTLLAMDEGEHLVFKYVSESPLSRCEVPGYATETTPTTPQEKTYVFRNDPEHQRWKGNFEGYLVSSKESAQCVILFSFKGNVVEVSKGEGDCRNFCGVQGGIGGVLEKISDY